MAIVKGPAMSLDASGSLAGAIVFSKWKGRNYVRQLVTPANPRSESQTGFRCSMRFLSQIWAGLSAVNKATWEDRAADMIVSEFNAFTSYNQKRWRNFLTPTKEDPAAEISAAPTAATGAAIRRWREPGTDRRSHPARRPHQLFRPLHQTELLGKFGQCRRAGVRPVVAGERARRCGSARGIR